MLLFQDKIVFGAIGYDTLASQDNFFAENIAVRTHLHQTDLHTYNSKHTLYFAIDLSIHHNPGRRLSNTTDGNGCCEVELAIHTAYSDLIADLLPYQYYFIVKFFVVSLLTSQ